MSDELRVLLTEDEYDEQITELASRLVVEAHLDGWLDEFRRETYDAVFERTYGAFHEEYPLSVIEHSDSDLGPHHTERSKESTDPVAMAEMQAHKLAAKDAASLMDDLQWELVDFDPDTGESVGLTAEGERVASAHGLNDGD